MCVDELNYYELHFKIVNRVIQTVFLTQGYLGSDGIKNFALDKFSYTPKETKKCSVKLASPKEESLTTLIKIK